MFVAPAVLLFTGSVSPAQPPLASVTAFQRTAAAVEGRLQVRYASPAAPPELEAEQLRRLRQGELVVEQLPPDAQPADAMLHHWRGTAFVPGATAPQLEHLLRGFHAYPQVFAPDVTAADAQPLSSDHVQAHVRVQQHRVITVVLDGSYDVSFSRIGDVAGYSASRSTRIAEVAAPGTPDEHCMTPAEEHGFLWRLNTYWTWQQRDGGLLIQVETISLSRAIPAGLGWVLRPYVTSVPRDSLQFTLRSAALALRHHTTY